MLTRRSTTTAALVVIALVASACGSGTGTAGPSGAGGSTGTGSTAPTSGTASESAAASESAGASESAAASESPPASAGASASASAAASTAPIAASGEIFAFGVSYETSDVIAKARVDLFKEKYPDVNVTFSESGFDSQGFLTALQSSDPPDVVRISRDRLGTYVTRGVLEPATDCIAAAGVNMGDYREAAVNQVTMDGVVYGMPEFYWVSNWLVDNDLFTAAGVDPATWDVSNWDQIAAANQALIDKTDTKVGIDPKVSDNGDRFPMWVRAAGGAMLSDDGKESLLDTPEVAEALTFTKSLLDAQGGLVKFKDALGQTGDFFGEENGFVGDLEGAFPMQQWYLNVLAGASPDTKFTAKPFLGKDGQPAALAEGDVLAITSASDNKDAACAFITTMTSTEAWVAAATQRAADTEAGSIQTGTSTANKAAEEEIFGSIVDVGDNATFKAALDAYVGTFDAAFALPASPAAEEFRQAWIDGVNAALTGEKEPAAAMQDADRVAQDAIDQVATP
ncbi:MAG: extracellular solute-binding protein [Candidatus Limnocylindrales bacterium]